MRIAASCLSMAMLLTLSNPSVAQHGTVVQPEKTTSVLVSNRDMNRIHCDAGDFEDAIWSQEKPLAVTVNGDNAYIKFILRKVNGKTQFTQQSTEIHLLCGGSVYTLIMQPTDADSITIRLAPGDAARLKGASKAFGGLPLEDQVKTLTLGLYRDEIPSGMAKKAIASHEFRSALSINGGISVVGLFDVEATGTGLVASEYTIQAPYNFAAELREQMFLLPAFGQNIVSVTIDPLLLKAGERGRLIIVSRRFAK